MEALLEAAVAEDAYRLVVVIQKRTLRAAMSSNSILCHWWDGTFNFQKSLNTQFKYSSTFFILFSFFSEFCFGLQHGSMEVEIFSDVLGDWRENCNVELSWSCSLWLAWKFCVLLSLLLLVEQCQSRPSTHTLRHGWRGSSSHYQALLT